MVFLHNIIIFIAKKLKLCTYVYSGLALGVDFFGLGVTLAFGVDPRRDFAFFGGGDSISSSISGSGS